MTTSGQSFFWPVFWACISGIVLLAGLVLEERADKEHFKTIASFRRWKTLKKWGEWFVILGVFGEIVVAGITAAREWRNDPRNQPLATASAVARLVTSEHPKSPFNSLLVSDGPAGWQSSVRFLAASNGLLVLEGGIGEVSVWEAGSETNREWRLQFHENKINFLSFNSGRNEVLVKQFEKADSLILTMPFPTNCTLESGSVLLTVNDLEWTFEIPRQKPKWGVITMHKVNNKAEIMRIPVLDWVSPPRFTNRWYDGQ